MEDHASLLALTKKTFSKISELKDFNDIYDNEFIKSYLPILDILYHDEHDASIKEEIEILITNGLLNRVVDTYFYHDLLSYIPYLRAISSSDIKPLIDQYLTFNTYFDVVELFTMHHLTQEEVQIVYNNCIVINK